MSLSAGKWPFSGRTTELNVVTRALSGHGVVVIAGASGVGKSRLAREVVARAADAAGSGIAVATESARDVPLGAFAPWLRVHAPHAPDVTTIQGATEALEAHGASYVLGVDDAHLLDGVSATVLHQLALRRAVRLVVTVRTGEPAPDAVTALWKDDLAERIELAPLDAEQTRALVRAALGGPVEAATERRLHATSGGNVLWLRHLVESERAAGRLVRDAEAWKLDRPPTISPALDELVAARLGRLSDAERRALELLALGEPLGLSLLERLVPAEDLEALAERSLVTLERDGARSELRLAHPLYGEVLRGRMSPIRGRRLRSELSEALGATGGRRSGDELRRAVLALGGDGAPDPDMLLKAASQAASLADVELAERLFRAARDAGAGFAAHIGLAQIMTWLMRPDEAEAELAAASAATVDDDQRAQAAATRFSLLHFVLGRPQDARTVLDEAEASTTSVGARATFRAARATQAVAENRLDEGRAAAEDALAVPDTPPLALIWACWADGLRRAVTGVGDPVAPRIRMGIDAARRTADAATWQMNLGYADVLDASLCADFDRARARVDWLREQPGPFAAPFVALYEGRIALETGRPATAVRLMESVIPYFPGLGGGWTKLLHTIVAEGLAMMGDADGARTALDHADKAAHPGVVVFDPELELARGLLCTAEGRLAEAIARATGAAASARAAGQFAMEVLARHTAVGFGDRTQAGRLAELTRIVDGRRADLAHAHALAVARRDTEGLLEVSRRLEDAELLIPAAEAAAQASVLAREAGRTAEAATAGGRAADLAERCENARTPALVASVSPLRVSDREREVIHQAARGLTNRQIADQLHVSVRTVESHIYRACSRLGLSDRAALIEALVPPRLRTQARELQ
ncbi:LuxR C-terminal-related transcriptional regulator [Actinomycetospora sp. TBRC 11914]|uniref:LuxR C-terminal-related transcriptional regulator n=1 Tax=Actinomycetospora sp. TBRC 11914 TaxID=2729387 RepID=UPI00145FC06D|nr:LuxR family transcriptional regulator [Actinomycetospora sp. TBRC 11914]NMO89334.1 helix-turn-helix transcriptional regulator [Actinomycetospora sp. TBRC 11914]